eukprot:TRINITY_DN1376_c0_g1_i22.p5 TRINITY_DN1376_c0_g1~~TRINITY_DN1376_c0_g1_i22.p5  ORF type:complete len:104 (-),score=2.77 TRINITY_DN1376_c0_g1_i22:691-1002(-)
MINEYIRKYKMDNCIFLQNLPEKVGYQYGYSILDQVQGIRCTLCTIIVFQQSLLALELLEVYFIYDLPKKAAQIKNLMLITGSIFQSSIFTNACLASFYLQVY